ncbi:hypothetical protein [Paraclostridium dentum]|uniref:hypothetical protein n=1 Tax=Paraclostridium dentum TaxID=2662455 RepID=UPI003F3ED227
MNNIIGLQSVNPTMKTTSIDNSNLVDYSNIKFPIEYGLKKLPNGVYDEIIKVNDSYKLIQRIGYYNMKDFTGFLSEESSVNNMKR